MLDDPNFLNQFAVNLAFKQLQAIFEQDFLADKLFSVPQATFYGPRSAIGLLLGCQLSNNSKFNWQASNQPSFEIEQTKQTLTTINPIVDNWRDLLLVLKLAGVDYNRALSQLQPAIANLQPAVPTENNQSKQLAIFCLGKINLVFTTPAKQSVGQWWRQCFEGYAHNLSFQQDIDQLNYSGWSSHPIEKPFSIIDLVFADDAEQTAFWRKNRALSGQMPTGQTLKLQTTDQLVQILETLFIAQATSFYLAALNQQPLRF